MDADAKILVREVADAVTADVVYVRTADVASAEIPVVLLSGS